MRKIIFITLTFAVCKILGFGSLWPGFMFAFLIMLFSPIPDSLLWEIPMGVLILAILFSLAENDSSVLIRILIPVSSVTIAFLSPKRLSFFFPLAICAIIFENTFFASALFATLWCMLRLLFTRKNAALLNFSD